MGLPYSVAALKLEKNLRALCWATRLDTELRIMWIWFSMNLPLPLMPCLLPSLLSPSYTSPKPWARNASFLPAPTPCSPLAARLPADQPLTSGLTLIPCWASSGAGPVLSPTNMPYSRTQDLIFIDCFSRKGSQNNFQRKLNTPCPQKADILNRWRKTTAKSH